MDLNPSPRPAVRALIACLAAGAITVSMLPACSDSDSKKKTMPGTTIEFIRGDSNNDGKVDLSDGVYTNNYLYLLGPSPVCLDAADADDNGLIEMSDSIFAWTHLFRSGPRLPEPFPAIGLDDTDDELTCESYVLSASDEDEDEDEDDEEEEEEEEEE